VSLSWPKMGYFYVMCNTVILIIFAEAYNMILSSVYKSSVYLLSLVNFSVVNLMTPNKSKSVVPNNYMLMNNELERMHNEVSAV
jgi:CDP-diglyceride synthetase